MLSPLFGQDQQDAPVNGHCTSVFTADIIGRKKKN
jgi:hypothetical protein